MRPTLCCLLLAVAACHHEAPPPDGDIPAPLTVPSLDEAAFDPASLHGTPALVLFISPSCAHCLKELPRAQAVARAAGAGVVAVFVSGNRASDRAFVQQTKFAGPVLVDDGSLRNLYAVDHVPYTLVLGGDGHARAAFIGERDEATLRDALADAR